MLIAAAVAGVSTAAQADVPLRIYGTVPDTVTTSSYTVVGVTSPQARATIAGNEVKVYPTTGSFGAKVDLIDGENNIEVTASLGGEKETEIIKIFRTEAKPKAGETATPASVPDYVQTAEGAYLQYGNGGDRLGGSKIGFLAPGITLRVLGREGNLYKVSLSEHRWAYLPISYAKAANERPVIVNTASWSVNNLGDKDRVTISLPTRLPYRYYTQLDPSSLIIELYGATDNSNWIVQRSLDLGMIDYVDFNQVESDVYQVIIRLKHQYQWGFKVDYNGTALVIDVRHTPHDLSWRHLTVGLDAGHGGEYPGARSISGILEKDVNLDIVLRLQKLIEKAGGKVVMTRSDDSGPSMSERKRIWREANVDLAVSVHNNSGGGALASPGTSTYYKHLFDRPLALAVLARMVETGLPLYGLTGNFNFSLNAPTEFPNTLVEGMFMSSLEEEAKIADPAFRQLVAEKIFAGLNDYITQVRKSLKK